MNDPALEKMYRTSKIHATEMLINEFDVERLKSIIRKDAANIQNMHGRILDAHEKIEATNREIVNLKHCILGKNIWIGGLSILSCCLFAALMISNI